MVERRAVGRFNFHAERALVSHVGCGGVAHRPVESDLRLE